MRKKKRDSFQKAHKVNGIKPSNISNTLPSDDAIYYAYACIVARGLDWRPQNIANTDEIYCFVNGMSLGEFIFLIQDNNIDHQNFDVRQKWEILKSKFNSVTSNQLNSSLLAKDDIRTVFLIWQSAMIFKKFDFSTAYTEFEKYFLGQENSLFNNMASIFLWMRRFEVYLCVNETYLKWQTHLKYAFAQRGKQLTALGDIKTEAHLASIYGTLGRLIQKYDIYSTPSDYLNHFSIECSLAMIQAWLDCQTEQTRAVIQPKLQQAIKQLVFREKQKKADKVPINSRLPAETMDAFNKFRIERGLSKEEALNFLILNGLPK